MNRGVRAQTLDSVTANPTSYTAAGQQIVFTISFHPGNRAWDSFTQTTLLNAQTLSCPPFDNLTDTIQSITCTSTYTTTNADLALIPGLSEPPKYILDGLVHLDYQGSINITNNSSGPLSGISPYETDLAA